MTKLKNLHIISLLALIVVIVFLSSCGNAETTVTTENTNSESQTAIVQEETVKEEPNEWLLFERDYYDEINYAINVLKGELKNPRSLEISDIIYYKSNTFGNIHSNVVIIYSAKNDLGNAIESACVVTDKATSTFNGESTITNAENIAKGKSNIASIEIWDDFYASSNDVNDKETSFAFYVDLNDFDEIKGL